ncbi:FtsK/SpoIIIE domain-containing protein [Streptomyces sp. NPDC005963]|uniref:FtsK/SpoIIIE domain-containing protein n=1 Tax=Streptomyces sp. NPDC005963 TaxID=3156721 RepID=UPI0033D500E0
MQIRLTVLAPRGGQSATVAGAVAGQAGPARARACDVLVTAPAGTALAAVASGLATAAAGSDISGAAVVLYAGQERLDAQRHILGEPPLVDGAVLSLQSPGEAEPPGTDASAQLHVVAGPDAGGVHLLHGGQISVGRSADADVPLDDPDVSRLHCSVTVGEDGRVTVADLGSTNGTTLDGRPVGSRPTRLSAGALLRLGESALRLAPGTPAPALPTDPDGEGHLRVPDPGCAHVTDDPGGTQHPEAPGSSGRPGPGQGEAFVPGGRRVPPQFTPEHPTAAAAPPPGPRDVEASDHPDEPQPSGQQEGRSARKRGIGAWARRLAGGRESTEPTGSAEWAGSAESTGGTDGTAFGDAPPPGTRQPSSGATPPTTRSQRSGPGSAERWPDPAAVLLTALGPGPRLWERGPGHPESLVLRLGTDDRDGLPSVPVTVGLREAGSLGLAGPRTRLAGLARWAVAQLVAAHCPAELEIVLISADRSRSLEERRAEWAWLGWLPHVRPGRGQDCRLLLAYDREQAAARTAELTRRLDDGPWGPGWPSADPRAVAEAAAQHSGGHTVVIVDGDPGSAALREVTARLAGVGRATGIHLIVLAETPAASPNSPIAATYETACAASLAFRECGAVAMLSGDVATALRLLRTAGGLPAGQGTLAAVDAVSAAWAERFARALAPLRTEGPSGADPATGRTAALPRSARLLDELGLARATPASLMARWASAADVPQQSGKSPADQPSDRWSDGTAVLGAGPRGPLAVDLVKDGPHLLIEGPPGSGRTELLRSIAASLAASARPDRLGLLLVDGAGGERGDGLGVCTELPHACEHLVASDPVRMRAFAQALGAELKRRAEVLGAAGFAEGQSGGRTAGQRPSGAQGQFAGAPSYPPAGGASARGDLDSPPSGTLRLRPGGRTPTAPTAERPLPKLVVLVDDYDALVAPALGSTGRPAAGSVVRALEAVARDGERLGVHLVATSARPEYTADTELARGTRLRAVLDAPPVTPGPQEPSPGRGRLTHRDGRETPFHSGRVTGRIPRTATLRPTVVPLEWERMGDPPTRRPVRELGNGPTDLALLASALERAASLVDARALPPLTPVRP